MARLAAIADVAAGVRRPGYDPARHAAGIVHIGVGAFHRAHQAIYTDTALAAAGGDWRIRGISLRGSDVADALVPQNGLYLLAERGAEGTGLRLVASIETVIAESRMPGATLRAIADPATRIVSLTVTEKAYGIDRATRGIDLAHPAIAADLQTPHAPRGVIGLLVAGLGARRAAGLAPVTVLCCDNLPDNGALLRGAVVAFAERVDPALAADIARDVPFPSTMVDRITPAPTDALRDEVKRLAGVRDAAAVEAETFTQWVIEDRFAGQRPAWEAGGAIFVDHVAPYEAMKLRMLNGSHSLIAYAGFLAGHRYVRDAMVSANMVQLVARHHDAAAQSLAALSAIDYAAYARDLRARFANPAIAHETYQIAMDGTEKLPQRILAPAVEAAEAGRDLQPFAFAVAAWMRYGLGRDAAGGRYALRDPREAEIAAAVAGAETAEAISGRLHGLAGLFPARLRQHRGWRHGVETALTAMLADGMTAAIAREASAA